MTVVRLAETGDGISVDAAGHAGFAETGRDVVCAAITMLLFGSLSYLLERERDGGGRIRVTSEVQAGALRFCTSGFTDGADRVVLGVIRAGLGDLAACYPKHVRVETVRNPEIHIH